MRQRAKRPGPVQSRADQVHRDLAPGRLAVPVIEPNPAGPGAECRGFAPTLRCRYPARPGKPEPNRQPILCRSSKNSARKGLACANVPGDRQGLSDGVRRARHTQPTILIRSSPEESPQRGEAATVCHEREEPQKAQKSQKGFCGPESNVFCALVFSMIPCSVVLSARIARQEDNTIQ